MPRGGLANYLYAHQFTSDSLFEKLLHTLEGKRLLDSNLVTKNENKSSFSTSSTKEACVHYFATGSHRVFRFLFVTGCSTVVGSRD